MKWWIRRRDPNPDDERLREAEEQVAELIERAEPVHQFLWKRHDRNHWAETVERLYRGESA